MARYKRFRPWMLNGHPGNISRACKRLIVRAHNAGLVVTSTTDGSHASTSYHYPIRNMPGARGRAVDIGLRASEVGTVRGAAKRVAFQRAEVRRPLRFREVFGPDNSACVKDGRRITLAEGSALETLHDNHDHFAPRW